MNAYTRKERRVDLACLSCGREAGMRVGVRDAAGGIVWRLDVAPNADPAYVRRLRCPYCLRGRLWASDERVVTVLLPVPKEEMQTKRGRPPKAKRPESAVSNPMCIDCRTRRAKTGRRRCQPCAFGRDKRRVNHGYYPALMALLRRDEPMPTRRLAAEVGCAADTVRHLVQRARARGVPIVREGRRGYRLEAAS